MASSATAIFSADESGSAERLHKRVLPLISQGAAQFFGDDLQQMVEDRDQFGLRAQFADKAMGAQGALSKSDCGWAVKKTIFVEVANPTETLLNEEGTFNMVSPTGFVFRVTCRKGRNMQVREIGAPEKVLFPEGAHHDRLDGSAQQLSNGRWQIEKIA